ncbi:hypothetical protein LCGC14_2356480 [marine sediment metagenome]|uniref:Uncharacterized protein n=1 Tax=marine sediment metagenome TaxID=412755 RepID=A0A0F9EKF1_9ZZZZ
MKTKKSIDELSTELEPAVFEAWLNTEEKNLGEMLKNEEWRIHFQGKLIFSKLCANVLKTDQLRIRQAYVDIALAEKPDIFKDLNQIFDEMK